MVFFANILIWGSHFNSYFWSFAAFFISVEWKLTTIIRIRLLLILEAWKIFWAFFNGSLNLSFWWTHWRWAMLLVNFLVNFKRRVENLINIFFNVILFEAHLIFFNLKLIILFIAIEYHLWTGNNSFTHGLFMN